MPKISVIFVTNRKGWENILHFNLFRQTFRDFEIIVADEYALDATIMFGDHHFKPREKLKGDVWNINKAYNDAIYRATGELLVFLQDYIWIPDDGLERFWNLHEKYPVSFLAGVGHKAAFLLHGISEVDPKTEGSKLPEEVNHTYFELNWGAAPRDIMPLFNEEMDKYYGGENQYVARKAILAGASVIIDRQNVCIGYSQASCGGRPDNWEIMHANKEGRLAGFLSQLSPP